MDYASSQESDLLPPEIIKDIYNEEIREIIDSIRYEDNDVKYIVSPESEEQENGTVNNCHVVIPLQISEIDRSVMVSCSPLSTCEAPATEDFPGSLNFEIEIDARFCGKNWVFSHAINKLFITINTPIQLGIKYEPVQCRLFVRGLLVFCEGENFTYPVVRCLYHSTVTEPRNDNEGRTEEFISHVLRIDHTHARYDLNEVSERRSVVVPLDPPQVGMEGVSIPVKFMCKNSCMSGMNRRPTELIFTLEDGSGAVLGRRKMKVRVCSCPKRDKCKEEREYHKDTNNAAVTSAKRLAQATPEQNASPPKLKKIENLPVVPVYPSMLRAVTNDLYSRLKFMLREEKRQATPEEAALLQHYKALLDK